jgi:predicted permease
MLNPRWAGYDAQRSKDFYRELIRRVRAWPEVQSAGYAFSVPLGYYGWSFPVYVDEKPVGAGEQAPVIGFNFTDGDYFETMQLPILRGRAFRESDNQSSKRVAIVNQAMAERFWPNQDPIGKVFHIQTADSPSMEVIGVAKNGKYRALFEGQLPYVYAPFEQNFDTLHVLHIRFAGPPESQSVRLRQEIRSLDPNMPVSDVQSLARSLNGVAGFALFRIAGVQAAALGMLGLFLAVIGVYGVVSYGAAQRTREIGIRMALGATPNGILRMILGYGTWMVLSGIIVGLTGAVVVTRFFARFLLFVSPTDSFTFVAVTLGLTAVALLACYLPARHAMRIEPSEALRNE